MKRKMLVVVICMVLFASFPKMSLAEESFAGNAMKVVAGAGASYLSHEAGHYLMAEALGGENVRWGRFITWNGGIDGKEENFKVSAAGFAMQNLLGEVALDVQEKHKQKSYFVLGILVGNLVQVTFYNEKKHYNDLHNMEKNSDFNESEIRAFLITKAVLDIYRYYHPNQKWSVLASRSMTGAMIIGVSFGF